VQALTILKLRIAFGKTGKHLRGIFVIETYQKNITQFNKFFFIFIYKTNISLNYANTTAAFCTQ
jgi:hypothetical protein